MVIYHFICKMLMTVPSKTVGEVMHLRDITVCLDLHGEIYTRKEGDIRNRGSYSQSCVTQLYWKFNFNLTDNRLYFDNCPARAMSHACIILLANEFFLVW